MPFPNKQLRVFPNPWLYIDHLGRPAGRLPFDGYEHSPSFGAIGATLTDVKLMVPANIMRVAGTDMEVTQAAHDHRITYSKDAVSIPNTAYYRDALKRYDLVAADKETAKEAGLKFEEPYIVLNRLKVEAVKKFNAETDEDAYSRFGSVEPFFDSPVTNQAPAPVAVVAAKASN